MADEAHALTDEKLEQMERHLSAIYSRAGKEIQATSDAYFAKFREDDEKRRKLVVAGKITEKDYQDWRRNRIMYGGRFKQLKEQVAEEMLNVNRTAMAYINGEMPEIYAMNYNALEEAVTGLKGYSFTLVDADTVRKLATEDETLLPYKEVDGKKDVRWNTKKVNSEVLQGIIQGDTIPQIANRLQNVTEMNRVSAVRNARTSITSAECKGRQDSFERAEKDGVQMQKEWISVSDGRTRHAHKMLNGQLVDVDASFEAEGEKIRFPGDPQAAPWMVYNCRCTVAAKITGFVKKAAEKATEAAQAVKSKFVPAKTVKEAEEYAKKFSSSVSYKGAKDVDSVNAVNKRLDELTEKYPTNTLAELRTNGRLRRANAQANYSGIEINTKFLNGVSQETVWSDYTKNSRSLIEKYRTEYLGNPMYDQRKVQKAIKGLEEELKYSRWAATGGDIARTITHEYGHVIADQYSGQVNVNRANKNFSYMKNNACWEQNKKIKETYKKAVENGDIYDISMYAATNEYEFFAETFVMYDYGEKLPDYVVEMLEGVLKGGIL